MKGKRSRKKNGFQQGHSWYAPKPEWDDNTSAEVDNSSACPEQYQRMDMNTFNDIVHEENGILCVKDSDNQPILGVRILRPRPAVSLEVHPDIVECLEETTRPQMECMRLFHPKKLENLYNNAFHDHLKSSPKCDGHLILDETAELKKGLCYKERLKCTTCTFTSKRLPLYEEVPSPTRGAKAAAPNIGIQVGLSHTPAGNLDFAHILNTAGIASPSISTMQRSSNKVLDHLEQLNKGDLDRVRKSFTHLNKIRGLPSDHPIGLEGDAQYNNSLHSGVGKTPFQPATQAIYTVSENVTKSKRIVGVHVSNKQCRKCGGQKSGSTPGDCPTCSANVPLDTSIGDEHHMVTQCMSSGLDNLNIKYVTTDQDSKASMAFKDSAKRKGSKVIPQKLDDTRHLSQSQRKAAKKMQFSDSMFPSSTDKEKIQARFALDLSKRCQGEYCAALKTHGANINAIVRDLSYTTDAIIQCYAGNHELCFQYSFLCKGQWPKYLNCNSQNKVTLNLNSEDCTKVRSLINFRLGRKAIYNTKFGTNTQKSESVNSSYVRSVPKFKNYSRNVYGRIHSRVHLLNQGRCLSTLRKLKALGVTVHRRTTVVTQLCKTQNKVTYDKIRQSGVKYKAKRYALIKEKYSMYDNLANSKKVHAKTYSKGMLDPKIRNQLTKCDHTYNKC